jgi:UDP-N-acetylmuramoylalanine--D-glutamate ligase
VTILVEGFDPDAIALARLFAGEGHKVRLAGTADRPHEAKELAELGIDLEPHADLDSDPGEAEIAYLDVWTPETAPRVQRLHAQGTRISCLGDLLLERWDGTSVGITGTAGKTTTTSLTAAILRAEGIDIAVSTGARAGNLWPTADLLDRSQTGDNATQASPGRRDGAVLLLELTSSHLAFMHHSPTVAAVISFWPDHLELHGDLAHYRAAKETIVRHQRSSESVVVNADDAASGFAAATPADLTEFSLHRRVEHGAYLDPARGIVLIDPTGETVLGPLQAQAAHPGNVVAAAAIAAAAGATAAAIAQGVRTAAPLPWRAQPLPVQTHGPLAGIRVVDDGMAATPLKTAATLAIYPDHSIVLIAGGLNDAGGGPVHATPEEHALLERACDEIARTALVVVVFGDGGTRLAALLQRRRVEIQPAADLAEAVAVAADRAAEAADAAAVVFSPLFPLPHEERTRFASLVCGLGAGGVQNSGSGNAGHGNSGLGNVG